MILGSIIGIVGSLIPEAFKFAKDWLDRRHELQIMEMLIKYAKELADIRIQEAKELASIELDKEAYKYTGTVDIKPTGFKFADTLQVVGNFVNQLVRPSLTFLICGTWMMFKYALWKQAGGDLNALTAIWNDMDNEFVSAVVFFWFSGRTWGRVFRRIK